MAPWERSPKRVMHGRLHVQTGVYALTVANNRMNYRDTPHGDRTLTARGSVVPRTAQSSAPPRERDSALFLILAAAASALTVLAARGRQREQRGIATITDAVDHAFGTHSHTHTWSAVYEQDGDEYVICAPGQPETVTAQQLADGVHGLTCPGCDRCSPLPATTT